MENNIILPFKCPYADCTVYCYNMNKSLVDFMNDKISIYLHDILSHISDKIIAKNNIEIDSTNIENIIKYIVYLNTDHINYALGLNIEYICYAVIVFNDDYFILDENNHKSNTITLFFDKYKVECRVDTNCVL
jgi:hypothetical protein